MAKKRLEKIEAAKAFLAKASSQEGKQGSPALDKKLIANLEIAVDLTENINSEIVELKLKLENKKNELSGHIENMLKLLKEAQKSVRKNFPKKSWRGFGITAK
jgi:hypothetical protein